MNHCAIVISGLLAMLSAGCTSPSESCAQTETVVPVFSEDVPAGSPSHDRHGTVVAAEPDGHLTLRDALALTLLYNPVLKTYSLETRAAEARALQAGLRPNPELGVEVENIGGSGRLSRFDSAETTVGVSQLIELGDKARKRESVASLKKELSERDYQSARIEILTAAGKAFISLLAAQEKTRLLAERVEVFEQTLVTVAHRVEAGKDSPLEKTRASLALSMMQIEHRQAVNEREKAKMMLASFWGSEQPIFTQAHGQWEAVSDIPPKTVLKQKLPDTPHLARWETEIAVSKAAAKLEDANAISDISILGGVRRFSETDDNAFVFGVSVPLPLFDRNQGGRMEAAANLAKSYEQQRAARIDVIRRFDHTYADLAASLSQIRQFQTSVLPGAREVFEASRQAYAQGKIDYLTVLDAQRTYFVSHAEYLDALASYHTAKTDLEGLIGERIE